MSKVKHLLRKLHIGDHQHHGRASALDASAQSSSLQQSNSTSPSFDLPPQSTLSSESENSNQGTSFSFLEEEFQMQLALAISVSDQGRSGVDSETAQIDAAKQISLGNSPSENLGEFMSLRFRCYNVLNYDEKVIDGFYDVCGMDSTLDAQSRIPSLLELDAISVLEDVGFEVVLVNRAVDVNLRQLEERVYFMSLECNSLDEALNTSFLVQKIADLIVEKMGGSVVDVEDIFRRWRARNQELKLYFNTSILPLGSLDIGHSRQRALLFKVLADRINLPCKLVKGSYYTGTDDGAVNLIKLDDGCEYIVDLMGAPGTLIPCEVPGPPLLEKEVITDGRNTSVSSMLSEPVYALPTISQLDSNPPADLIGKTTEPVNSSTERLKSDHPENGFRALSSTCNSTGDRPDKSLGEFLFKLESREHEPASNDPGEQNMLTVTRNKMTLNDVIAAAGTEVDSSENNALAVPVSLSDESNAARIQNMQIEQPELTGVAEILWEDLQIGERIGIGSYGEVHRAEWNGTEVAVKKFMNQDISGDALAQFESEVEIMLRLRHPNVVLFMGAVTRPPNLSILTELLPRGSLYKLLHRPNCQIDERRRIRMAIDVAKGMNYLHSSHPIIVHRDLKTPNLLVDKNWVVKVCDFGMSRLQHNTFLSSKSAAGTAEWMAPEVLRNEPSNEKSDVYSFGVILWELATLQVPWSGMNSMQVVGAVGFQGRHLEIPDGIDPSVADVINDCWNIDAGRRPCFSEIIRRLKLVQWITVKKKMKNNK